MMDDVASTVKISAQHEAPSPKPNSAAAAPATQSTSSSARTALEKYLLLAKSARGAAASKLVEEATAAPGCFVFAELLQTAGVKDLAERFQSHLGLLQLFAYGTWPDYKQQRNVLLKLNAAQEIKLKQLTLVSMAMRSRRLEYSQLRHVLDVASDRELEDLIIDCIYADLLSGRLDQRSSRLDVDQVLCARDVAPAAVGGLASELANWSRRLHSIIGELDRLIGSTREQAVHHARLRSQQNEYVQRAVTEAQSASAKGGRGGTTSYTSKAAQEHGDVMDVDNVPVDAAQGSPRKQSKAAPRKRARA